MRFEYRGITIDYPDMVATELKIESAGECSVIILTINKSDIKLDLVQLIENRLSEILGK